MHAQAKAFFLSAKPGLSGQRFCLFYPAQVGATEAPARGSVLHIHPFAEEMNKTRRMAALQARALAQAGFDVLQMDLQGCGDSSGDFGDATWNNWVNDVQQGCHWLRARRQPQSATGANAPLWLWGVRAGCLLAAQAASQGHEDCNFLFWQPPAAGRTLLQQFLRLKTAGHLLGSSSKSPMADLRQQLASGSSVEVAGYRLSSELALGLEQATLTPPANNSGAPRLEWFEVSPREDAHFSPATREAMAPWEQAGFAVGSHLVRGPAFWQTSEIEEAPALLAASTAALLADAPSPTLEMSPA